MSQVLLASLVRATQASVITAPRCAWYCTVRIPWLLQAWAQPADRRYRSLTLYLAAQVVRALARLGQQQLLAEALRCDLALGPASQQLGLVGVSRCLLS
jgi:hypothetical protein